MGFTCQVVRGSSVFIPCLEHVRAGGGGGGSVANALFHVLKALCIVFSPYITLYLHRVASDTLGCHRDMRGYVWRT